MGLEASKKLFAIAKVQFDLILTANLLLAIALCLLTPILFGMRNLDSYGSSFVLERFVSLIGILLLTPLFMPEQERSIGELVQAKPTNYSTVLLVRLALSIVLTALCIAIMIAVMRLWHCDFEAGSFFLGTFATAFFLGSIGFCVHAVTHQVVTGYLAATCIYMLNFSMGVKLKSMYIFSLALGSMREKYWLLGAGVILLVLSFLWTAVAARIK